MKSSKEIRDIWKDFFTNNGHYFYESASLIPLQDESILWINSGVAVLKKYFEGKEEPPKKRIANIQKSIRTNDIENIGITSRHHSFFEMMGNFSIGDYFKETAIDMANDILFSKKYFGFDKKKIFITVFSEDNHTYNYWLKKGIDSDHIFKMGRETNFWDLGIGPSGPSTEIFYDRGEKFDLKSASELIEKDKENDRFIEIWNIVFSEFNNMGDGVYKELPNKNIDTGAGLERIVSICQNTPTNFETDLFKPIILKINELSMINHKYIFDYIPGKLSPEIEAIQQKFKAIADFMRTIVFAIADGAVPSNSGRGYVIRRLIRKNIVLGQDLNIDMPFSNKLVDTVIEIMIYSYPYLSKRRDLIIKIVKEEEIKFIKILSQAEDLILKTIKSKGITDFSDLSSDIIFMFYETYGLPFEFLERIFKKYGILISKEKFEMEMQKFQNLSRKNRKDSIAIERQSSKFQDISPTEFIGYSNLNLKAEVIAKDGMDIVFDKTVFYATSGGQVHDRGTVNDVDVINVKKNSLGVIVHTLTDTSNINVGDFVDLCVDVKRREGMMKNHSGIHLVFSALEKLVNNVVPQAGSKVEQDFFRFDFSYHRQLSSEELTKITNTVRKWISQQIPCEIITLPREKAKEMGATFLEGVVYDSVVRVVKFDQIALDLCGGTHVNNTREIEDILITDYKSKGSGIYRIKGICGNDAISKWKSQKVLENKVEYKEKIEFLKAISGDVDLGKVIENAINDIDNGHDPKLVYDKSLKIIDEINNKVLSDLNKEIDEFLLLSNSFKFISLEKFERNHLKALIKDKVNKLNTNNLLVIKNFRGDFSNISIMIGKEVEQKKFFDYLNSIISDLDSIKGGGKNRLIQYGGSSNQIDLLRKRLEKWEF